MNRIGRIWIGGCLIGWTAAVGTGQPPSSGDDKKSAVAVPGISELIEDLGHPVYSVREKATRELWKRGEAARNAVAVAAKSNDAEIARRAKDLLDKFEWGIFPDTPPAVLKLLKDFRSNDLALQKTAILEMLKAGKAGRSVLRAALAKATPEDVKAELAMEPGTSNWRQLTEFVAVAVRREALAQLLEDRREDADELLSLNALGTSATGLSDHAAYQYLRGTLPQAIAKAEAVRQAGGPTADTAKIALVYLYRAQRDWKRARAMAHELPQSPGDPPVIEMLLEEEGDWAGLAKRNAAGRANLPDGMKLTLLRLSGKTMEFEQAASDVVKRADEFSSREDVQQAAFALLLNQRAAEATALLLEKRMNLGLLSELLIAEMRFKNALELVGSGKKALAGTEPRESAEFDLRRSRLLFLLGRRSDAIQLFGQVAEFLRLNPEGGRVLSETGIAIRSLLRAEMRLGLRDLAAEHAASFLASDDGRFRELFRWGESPFEILFDNDARAAESLFWVLRNARVPGDAAGTSLRRVRELFTGTATKEAVDQALKHLRDPSAGDPPDRENANARNRKVERLLAEAAILRAAKRNDEAEKAYAAAAEATVANTDDGERPSGTRSWVYGTSDDFRPWMELGDFLADRGRHKDAARQFEAGWKRFPDQPLLLYLCGRALVKAGSEAEGRRRLELAHWVSLGNERARGRFLEELIRRGAAAAAKRERDLLLHACWSRDGFFGNVMNQAARASLLNKDFATAESCVQRSLMVLLKVQGVHFVEPASYLTVPQNMAAHRARALAAAGKIDEAMKEARSFLAVQPGHTELVIGMAAELEKAGRKKDADELFRICWDAYEKMLADYPESAAARNSAAWLAANCRRELVTALKYAEEATKADPNSVSFRETLAEVHFRRGDREKALALMTKLADESPRSRLFRRQLERYRSGDPASEIPDTEPE